MKFLYGFLIALIFLISPKVIFASDSKFLVTSDSTYKIADNGVTTVNQNFTFTNTTSQYFPSEYVANLPVKDVYNLRAFDKTGALQIKTALNGDVRQVTIQLGDQAIGIGTSVKWSLAYETSQIAQKQGRLWEIFVPRPAVLEGESDFTVGIYIPTSFGKKIFIKPGPTGSDLVWKRADLQGAGIFAVYDPNQEESAYQAYDFSLIYHLYNPKLYSASVEIALPPDTQRQKIMLNDLNPKPINVRLDEDGNWLAKYQLGPAQKQDIKATGSVAVFLENKFPDRLGSSPQTLLSPQKFWETNDQKISQLSKEIISPQKIFNFVVNTLHYDNTRVQKGGSRLGAKAVLSNPLSAGSLEFSDLFVALARGANIPAREVEGFAVTTHSDIQPQTLGRDALHSWAEYFDSASQSWIPVDPTWARTTNGSDYFHIFDFDHIVFAIHGQSSFTPQTAGTYKSGDDSKKDVSITYHQGNLDFAGLPKLGLSSDFPTQITSGFVSQARVFVENYGPTTFGGDSAILSSSTFNFQNPSLSTGELLPFANKTLTFSIMPLGWLEDKNDIINLQFGQQARTFTVESQPFYKNKFILTVSILFTLGILSIFAQIARSLFVSRRRRESNLRGKSEKSS